MKNLIVVRPLPGAMRTVAAASAMGLVAIPMPVQDYEPVDWQEPEGPFDGLLVGSAMAFRFPSPMFDATLDLPVHAVGRTTAAMAESAGYTVASVGEGGLQAVLDGLPDDEPLRLLRVGGEDKVALEPPPHVELVECAVYRLIDVELTEGQAKLLRSPVCVLLHSAGAARSFRRNCERLALDREAIALACLGPRIAQAAGTGWGRVMSASTPNDTALLALARTMCQ